MGRQKSTSFEAERPVTEVAAAPALDKEWSFFSKDATVRCATIKSHGLDIRVDRTVTRFRQGRDEQQPRIGIAS